MRYVVSFKDFWDAYGLKRDRISAERAWNRLSAKDKKNAFEGIGQYRDECRRSGVSMMYAQGYINHRRWEDEAIVDNQDRELSKNTADGDLFADMKMW